MTTELCILTIYLRIERSDIMYTSMRFYHAIAFMELRCRTEMRCARYYFIYVYGFFCQHNSNGRGYSFRCGL